MISIEETVATLASSAPEAPGRSAASASADSRGPRQQPDASRLLRLDQKALRAVQLLPEVAQERRLSDQYRAIKRPILQRFNAMVATAKPGYGAQLLLVTSALPGDGKTFTSLNLALSIARERDISVLLIDADVAKPHISRMLGVDREPGLLDALVNPAVDPEMLVRPTDVAGLSILPVGTEQDSATELLSSARMRSIFGRMSALDPWRLLIFDSPPLLLSNDSWAIVQIVRQVVLVVRSGITPQRAVQDAISRIDKEKITGLVLNQNDLRSFNQYYGYGTYGVT
jgi:protein-tyrosine kinase